MGGYAFLFVCVGEISFRVNVFANVKYYVVFGRAHRGPHMHCEYCVFARTYVHVHIYTCVFIRTLTHYKVILEEPAATFAKTMYVQGGTNS